VIDTRPGTVRFMEQRISIVTLGVADLARSTQFYEALGWRGQELQETVFFQAGGQAVVLWGREKVAEDVGIADDGSGFGAIALAQNVRSREEVDEVIAAARAAGAAVTKEPAETFYGGYAGYFLDPDGHAWEVAHNPGFTIEPDGSLTLPDFGAM
jgi:predicted lactoylglutathione lyase